MEPIKQRERVFKGMQRQRWAEDTDRAAELAAARGSFYYWWWAFLRESQDFRKALTGKKDEPYATIARDFGRLGDSFETWWLQRGRDLFAEKVAIPRVRCLEHGIVVNLEQINPKLVVELPLTIRRATILRQVNRLLEQYHQGPRLKVLAHSSAQRKLYAKSRMRLATLALLHAVWVKRKENPQLPWWEIGERVGVSPVFKVGDGDEAAEVNYKRRCMTLVVQRYHRKAAALVAFAAKGDFPRVK